jgi:SpoVK/Ycf46/Vps4 family AAA+-type ATPase
MSELPEEIQELEAALAASPQNKVVGKMLAKACYKYGLYPRALELFRECLRQSPDDRELLSALAHTYHRNGQNNEALVILESMMQQEPVPAAVWLLHARLMAGSGHPAKAAQSYLKAKAADGKVRDEELEEELKGHLREQAAARDEDAEEELAAALPSGDQPSRPVIEIEKPKLRFEHVGGMEPVKKDIRLKIILPLQQPDLYKAYGKTAGGGILMYGPPGCGKTLLARATAGQVNARFIAVGIHEVLDMWIGQSERNLHELFEQARSNRPCVLFFDEVDALAASRSDMKQNAGRQLINQFLDELDGVRHSNEGVLILAATNAPWHLDPAFRRPGRFDRILFVPPPDEPARAAILEILLKGKPVAEVDCGALAAKTQDFSGADLKALVDRAVDLHLEAAAETGEVRPLRQKDLLQAAKAVKPSTKEWFTTAKNYALYSNQGGHYDDILDYLKLR